jgi:hypothetical protein
LQKDFGFIRMQETFGKDVEFDPECADHEASKINPQLVWAWNNYLKSKDQDEADRWQDLFSHLLNQYFYLKRMAKRAQAENE